MKSTENDARRGEDEIADAAANERRAAYPIGCPGCGGTSTCTCSGRPVHRMRRRPALGQPVPRTAGIEAPPALPPRGSLAWVRQLAGPSAVVHGDAPTGTVRVTLPESCTMADAEALQEWLQREGPLTIDFIVERAAAAPTDDRRAREAPLVALVNAVPEGLDPNGWRAAVLGYSDTPAPEGVLDKIPRLGPMLVAFVALRAKGVAVDVAAERLFWEAAENDDDMATGRVVEAMRSYARAVAPQGPRPKPERRRAPGLPVDTDPDLDALAARWS